MKKNTMLCIDLKTLLQMDRLPREGKAYHGDLMLDDEFHACFVERSGRRGRRNTRIFDGKHITLTYRAEDGRMRFNFKQMVITPRFNFETYANEVAREIRIAINGLVEK